LAHGVMKDGAVFDMSGHMQSPASHNRGTALNAASQPEACILRLWADSVSVFDPAETCVWYSELYQGYPLSRLAKAMRQ